MNQKIGMLGLGIMGSAMSKNLLDAGFKVVGYDVVPHKVGEFQAFGGQAAASASEVAQTCGIVVSVLPTMESVLDSAEELAREGRPGLTLIECSTMPLETKEAARQVMESGNMKILDCPLSGTGAQAANKDLSVYASGDRTVYEHCVPVFLGFARSHYLVGDFGAGTKMKFVANLLVAIHNVSAAEAFVLGMKAGLDPEMILKVVGDGAGSSRMFEVRGPLMVADEYHPATMKVDIWQKDMKIIGAFARELQCPTPLFAAAAQLYTSAMATGLAKKDTASVCSVLEKMAGHTRPKKDP
ncbi:MAG: NAD(P)-dependent oxidoreductase [Deltaproteobacteria bacterium]|nr:NAD(P)-dependent oxidoreductase [Deltaproteobacteria bacterium]